MGKVYAYLSFFKENKIDYIYHSKSQLIEFPCIYCLNNTFMCSQTSVWRCTNCGQGGNIISLFEYAKYNTFGNLFEIKKEQRAVLEILDQLALKYTDDESLLTVKKKVISLINYYEKTPYHQ